MKVWYFLCILFFFYNLSTLVEESYEVVYRNTTEKNKTEKYLACFDLKKIIYSLKKLKKIGLNQLNMEVYNYFDKMNHRTRTESNLRLLNESILVPILQRECLVFRDMFCFQAEIETILSKINIINIINPKFKNSFIFFVYKNDTFDLVKISMSNKFDRQIVLHRAYPYSNCKTGYSRFHCLNKCFKGKNRLSKYLYTTDETDGIIQLNYDNNNTTLKDDENECFKKCKNNGCKFTYFTKNPKFWENSRINFFKACPTMSSFDYWIQLAGFVFFFTGLSSYQILSKFIKMVNSSIFFNQFLSKFIKLIRFKIQKDKLKQRLINSAKTIIFVIMISFLIYSYINVIATYNHDLNKPTKKEISLNLLEPESISLVICISLHDIFTNSYGDDIDLFEKKIFRNKSLLELEKDSDIGFNGTLDEIYIVFQSEKIEVKWTVKPKVIFYGFSRCFLVDVFPSEPKYQSALSITKLNIKFKRYRYSFFLLPYGQSFHLNSYRFNQNYNFIKKIRKSVKECENYNHLNSKSPCISQGECINRCYNQKFIKIYGNISDNSIIDKDYFTKEQWEKIFVDQKPDRQIKTKCEKEITRKDCLEVNFEKNIHITSKGDKKIITLDLFYDVIMENEERPPLYKLILDMINIQSILFGINALKLPIMIYRLIKNKLRNCLLFIIYVSCIGGLIYQTYQILNEIINGDLINNLYYTTIDSIEMPEVIICFSFDELFIDMNHKLTGHYLDEITKYITETVFETISYLDNRTNEWITLKSNFTDDQLRIEQFFLLNEKCFKIILEMNYHKDQFHFFLDSNFGSNVLGIFFNRSFIHRMPYFMTKHKDKIQFSKLLKLSFKDKTTILISQELFELIYYDKFNFIKNPSSLLNGENEVNDPVNYLSNLLNNFKSSFNHLRTLKIPLKKNHFKFEVDDDLFEQYYLQVQNVTDKYLSTGSNYTRSLTTNYYSNEANFYRQKPDFVFNLIFFKKNIVISNDDSSTKLVLNLLNILSFWFDLGLLDIHIYFLKIKKILVFIFTWNYQILLKAKKSIYFKLNPQRTQNRLVGLEIPGFYRNWPL